MRRLEIPAEVFQRIHVLRLSSLGDVVLTLPFTLQKLVNRIRPHYGEGTNLDVFAWHEAFADLVALFHHFAYRDVVSQAIRAIEFTELIKRRLIEAGVDVIDLGAGELGAQCGLVDGDEEVGQVALEVVRRARPVASIQWR